MDLPRTWSGLQLFDNSGPFYNQISVVLEAYATLRPDVGYVQGKNSPFCSLLSSFLFFPHTNNRRKYPDCQFSPFLCFCMTAGMSYIAAMLLLYMDTYDAFVSLANLLNSHFFLSLFKMNLKEVCECLVSHGLQ